jgi:hypothetical protein
MLSRSHSICDYPDSAAFTIQAEGFWLSTYSLVADGTKPDIGAIRDRLHFVLERTAHKSEEIRSLPSTWCLSPIEILLEGIEITSQPQRPSTAAIVFRAKQRHAPTYNRSGSQSGQDSPRRRLYPNVH